MPFFMPFFWLFEARVLVRVFLPRLVGFERVGVASCRERFEVDGGCLRRAGVARGADG